MSPEFTADFFTNNRKKLRELAGTDAPMVFTANGAMQRNGDYAYFFRQDSSFWYLTGITEADIVLVMDGDEEYLVASADRNPAKIAFDGALDPEDLVRTSGVKTVYGQKEGW